VKKAFISYRRQDTEGYAHSLHDRLRINFNSQQIFMDVDDIKPGDDFVEILKNNLKDCAVLIVLIGDRWVDIKNSRGERRLDNPDDFVRIEVATALGRGIPVIPVLVKGASMPTKDELPENLKDLSQRQAILLTGASYDHGIEQLVSSIERYFGSQRRSVVPPSTPWYKNLFFKTIWVLLVVFIALVFLGAIIEEYEKVTNGTPAPTLRPAEQPTAQTASEKIRKAEAYPPTSILTDDSKTFQLAKVIDPPSNIRAKPNGKVICQATSSSIVTVKRTAKIASNSGKWYETNFCGKDKLLGYIHESQIRLRK